MKEFDHDGLILADMQGELFEKSITKLECSSLIFIRRFMNSNIAMLFDSTFILDDTLTLDNIYEELNKEYKNTTYGIVKYNSEVLYWIGYLYRYFSYTYEFSSKYVYKIIKPKELNEIYLPYHTFSCQQAIERILEYKNLSFSEDKMFKKGVEIFRKIKNEDK